MTEERMAADRAGVERAVADWRSCARDAGLCEPERINWRAEVEARTGAAKGARSPLREVQRNGIPRPVTGTPEPGGSRWRSRSSGRAATSRSFTGGQRRNPPRRALVAGDSRKPTSTGSRRGRSMIWSRPWVAGGMSKSQVSRLCGEIDERVNAFLSRPLEGAWPYLWLRRNLSEGARGRTDHQPCRDNSRGGQRGRQARGAGRRHRSLGGRDLLDRVPAVSRPIRGLRGVKLVIADDHKGLRSCLRAGSSTRPTRGVAVHWMRNALAHAPAKQRTAVAAMLKTIFAQESQGRGRGSVGDCRRCAARKAAKAQRTDGRFPR